MSVVSLYCAIQKQIGTVDIRMYSLFIYLKE
jgi:hypothetical protein